MGLIMELANDLSVQHCKPTTFKNNQGSSQESVLDWLWVQDQGCIIPLVTKIAQGSREKTSASPLTGILDGWPFREKKKKKKRRRRKCSSSTWRETVLPVCFGLSWTPGSFQLEPRNADGVWSLSARRPWHEEAFRMMGWDFFSPHP